MTKVSSALFPLARRQANEWDKKKRLNETLSQDFIALIRDSGIFNTRAECNLKESKKCRKKQRTTRDPAHVL